MGKFLQWIFMCTNLALEIIRKLYGKWFDDWEPWEIYNIVAVRYSHNAIKTDTIATATQWEQCEMQFEVEMLNAMWSVSKIIINIRFKYHQCWSTLQQNANCMRNENVSFLQEKKSFIHFFYYYFTYATGNLLCLNAFRASLECAECVLNNWTVVRH